MELFKINVQVHWILMSTWRLERQVDPEDGGDMCFKKVSPIYISSSSISPPTHRGLTPHPKGAYSSRAIEIGEF